MTPQSHFLIILLDGRMTRRRSRSTRVRSTQKNAQSRQCRISLGMHLGNETVQVTWERRLVDKPYQPCNKSHDTRACWRGAV